MDRGEVMGMRPGILLFVLFFPATASAQTACECAVTFGLTGSGQVAALQFDTTYTDGDFRGSGADVSCGMLQGSFAAFNDRDLGARLSTAIVGLDAGLMESPGSVAACTFDTDNRALGFDAFSLTLVDVTPVVEGNTMMGMRVSSIACICDPLPTTTSTTTTTLAPGCILDGECGDICWYCSSVGACELSCGKPLNRDSTPLVSDVLFILQAAVDLEACPLCLCDTNGDGSITSDDAQISLYLSVEIPADLNCPFTTPSSTMQATTTTMIATTTTTTLGIDLGMLTYENECSTCHRLGLYDVLGFAPDLSGKGSLLVLDVSTITGAHPPGLTYTQGEIDALAAFLDGP